MSMAALVAAGRRLEGFRRNEEASGRERVDDRLDTGFQPVVEIGDGQGEPGGIDGGEHMAEYRQLEPLEVNPGEELAGGVEVGDEDG